MEAIKNKKTIVNKKYISNIIIFFIGLIILLIDPFKMNLNQRIVMSSLIVVIIWWTTGYVKKYIACIFLLLMFIIFGNTSPYEVVKFAFSPSFYLIIFSFLLSDGISNSKVADRIASTILIKHGKSPIKLVILSFLFGAALIFIIPQPFSRVILLAAIYKAFIKVKVQDRDLEEVLIFSIFLASTTTSMLFINGDIILNYSALQFGQVSISSQEWIRLMLVPSILANIIVFFTFLITFRNKLKSKNFSKNNIKHNENKKIIEKQEIRAVFIMFFVVALWLTEGFHGINSTYIALLGVIAMFQSKILGLKDLKLINFELLLFLVTAFAIGTVIKRSGVSSIIFSKVSNIMPSEASSLYLLSIILIVMALHMVIGSCITTLSVAVPSFVEMTNPVINPLVIVLLSYITVTMHFILPFQHVTIMIGSANKFYKDKLVLKFGIIMTVLTILIILFVFIPWWRVVGII